MASSNCKNTYCSFNRLLSCMMSSISNTNYKSQSPNKHQVLKFKRVIIGIYHLFDM
jgi:hypothetical protein